MNFDPVTYSHQLEDALGCPPLVRARGKGPFDKGWQIEGRRDPERWRRKLENWTGNLALVTGGLLIGVDADLYEPGGEDSWDSLRDRGFSVYTPTNLSGGGGRHYLYEIPPGVEIPSRSLPGYPGVQIKGRAGALIAPPSIHPDTGRAYEWEFGWGPFDCPLFKLGLAQCEFLGAGNTAGGEERELDGRDEEAVKILLEHFGGHSARRRSNTIEVTRPGKERGCSAEVGFFGPGTVRVWSSNWPGLPDGIYELWKLRKLAGIPSKQWNIPMREHQAYTPIALLRSRRQAWLWQDRLPAAQLVLVAGREKLGKSTALVWMGARVTRGELDGDYVGEPGNVVLISAEDDAERQLKPRALAATADSKRFYVLDPRGTGFSVAELAPLEPRLVILDPLSAYIALATNNEHGEVAVRQALLPFQELAADCDAAVIGARHTRKGPSTDNPFDVVLGSRAWSAAPRQLLFFTTDPQKPDRAGGLIFPRGNLARPVPAARYRLDSASVTLDDATIGEVPRFVLEDGAVSISLEDALGSREVVNTRQEAEEFLREELAAGAVSANEVIAHAVVDGISETTLHRAKRELKVISSRQGFGPGSVVYWSLPAIEAP